ncbi:uncharacterized protein LY79DRAFT_538962 [Colletotrichum navitas]|uniref:Uncharacterized protein n=1 Tax=Colletotrichum navitas TaxID=681940 RepID=A0AAD8Q9T7_9PEZI|nr:uncharacterized protein LY79DRAFT_538962 [Colletotrichum navitas]KAK1598360.1 hypothetical protein LY79DRAFT_538962 [Colletotrichum navitas]
MNAVLQKALFITGFCIIHLSISLTRGSSVPRSILVLIPSFWEREQPSILVIHLHMSLHIVQESTSRSHVKKGPYLFFIHIPCV